MTSSSVSISVAKPTEEDQQRKREALEIWDRARMDLVQWKPFLGSLAMQLEIIPVADDRCMTASTDGRRIFCSAEYILERSDDESMFILAHEVLHCALLHFSRQRGKMDEHRMWNFAIDHEVNALLEKDGLKVPDGAVIYREYLDCSAEQVFQYLLEKVIPLRGELVDEHLNDDPPEPQESGEEHLVVKVDPDYTPMRSDSVWREWASKVMTAAQHAQSRGESSSMLQRILDALDPSNVDWKTLLRRWTTPYMGGSRTWLPPNRRYVHQGLYLPSRRGHRIDMVVVIDTSGSVWEHGVIEFLSELQAIISSFGDYEITVLQVDTEVRHVEVFEDSSPFEPERFHIEGGGGNRFAPAFEWVAENRSNQIRGMVYMTDGYLFTADHSPPPSNPPPYPVLWALTEDGQRPVDWGDVLKLEQKRD